MFNKKKSGLMVCLFGVVMGATLSSVKPAHAVTRKAGQLCEYSSGLWPTGCGNVCANGTVNITTPDPLGTGIIVVITPRNISRRSETNQALYFCTTAGAATTDVCCVKQVSICVVREYTGWGCTGIVTDSWPQGSATDSTCISGWQGATIGTCNWK